jgi:nitrate/nitrite-specific signal transduction histidine kinase
MIRDETEGNYLLSVVDTGSGMPQIDEIEECGLSVVRDIANSLRGTVEVTPTGKGAHITMAVPIPVLSGL